MNQEQRIALEELDHLYQRKLAEVEGLAKTLELERANLEHLKVAMELIRDDAAVEFSSQTTTVAVSKSTTTITSTKDVTGLIPEVVPLPLDRLRGLSQPRAMIVIAKHNGGYLRTRDLTKTLIKAGLMKLTKNSVSIASRLIRDSERFERIADGYYKLKVSELPAPAAVVLENSQQLQ